jgi:hypothetical protein
MMDPTQFVVWAFFAIFLITAILSLGSLPGWVPLPGYYKKKLFVLLIVEVVGCVCTFGVRIFNSITSPKIELGDALLSPQYGWSWQYTPQRMLTSFRFQTTKDGKIVMDGTTCVFDAHDNKQEKIEIFKWKSTEPFDIPADAIDRCINNAMIQRKEKGNSEWVIQPRSFSGERRIASIEPRISSISSSTSLGQLFASFCLAKAQTPSSGLSCGA